MDSIQTYAFEFKGGLVSNLSPLQHGTQAPGSARILKNFEPSVDGGYRRIEGFEKYDDNFIPSYGEPLVYGSGQTGTTLILGNIYITPVSGDIFTIDGVAGTYVVSSVSYDEVNKRATLVLSDNLSSSPANLAQVTFITNSGLVNGVCTWNDSVVAYRNGSLFRSTGSGWVKINKPNYGVVKVNGGSQTGSSLTVDGLTNTPQIGDVFTIDGVNLIYTVIGVPTVTSGAATISINPALASSPADNSNITWQSNNISNGIKLRTSKYSLAGVHKVVGVNGANFPFTWDGINYTPLAGSTDLFGAEFVVFFKQQLFFAKAGSLYFTSPYTDNDFSPANGAGVINVNGQITGLIVFRETLIIFTERTISQLTGNTLADFNLQPITRNIGCISPDSIQEISGDVIFLGPDGLRLLGATNRIGDFSLGLVSKNIQNEMTQLISSSSSFSSVVIRQKSQYRIFGYNATIKNSSAKGILGTQLAGDNNSIISWGEISGINAFVADSYYENSIETIVFANSDGYVYQMERGNSFDGNNIKSSFATPYVPITDPRIRKTFYKVFLYTDPSGSVSFSMNLKLDFDDFGSIQPPTINITNDTGSVGFYGSSIATYGITVYGDKLKKLFQTQVIGSGFSVSLQFVSDGQDPPFSLDAATLDYSSHDRR